MGAFLGNLYSRGGERQFMRAGIIYARNQENRTGPFSYILADLTKFTGNATGDLPVDNSFQISQRPVISFHQYKALAEQKKPMDGMCCCSRSNRYAPTNFELMAAIEM
jgi:hypothetical protein